MLKILWNRGEIAPEEQFLLLFTIFSYLMLDFYVKTRIGFSLRDKRLFEITEVEITRVDCSIKCSRLRVIELKKFCCIDLNGDTAKVTPLGFGELQLICQLLLLLFWV